MNRREFIHKSSLATAVVGVTPSWNIELKENPLKWKSLKYGMIKEGDSVLDKFKLAAELGFDGIELDSPNDLAEGEILDARDKTGLKIPGVVNSLHWKMPLSDPDASVRASCTKSMIEAFSKCKLYGGDTVLLVPAVVRKEISYDDAWERATVEIEKMLPEAEKTGIKIAVENVWNNFLISPMEAAQFIDQFESDHIGWYFDVGNVIRYGWPEQWIRILEKRILKIDIKDYSRDKQQNEGIWKGFSVKLGEGDADWTSVNNALREVGYSGWGSAEVAGGNRERLQEISERMDTLYAM
jgi:hexulose-6-phosphate isomerase